MFYKSLALFLFVYSSKFKFGNIQFATWEIGFALFLIMYLLKKYVYKAKRMGWKSNHYNMWWIIELYVCIFSIVWNYWRITVNDQLESSFPSSLLSPVIFIIFALVAPKMVLYTYNDFWEFIYSLMYINLFQSIFCLIELRWMPLKNWLYEHVANEGNVSYLVTYRAKGIGGEGAALSVAISFGILAACIILSEKEKKIRYYLYILIMFASLILVGRTGIYTGILFVLGYMYVIYHKKKKESSHLKININTLFFFILVSIAVIAVMLWRITTDNFIEILQEHNLGSAYGRIGQTYRIGLFMEDFLSWKFPKINLDSILGYGTRMYTDGRNVIYGDNGYIINTLIYGYFVGSIRYGVLAIYLYNVWRPIKNFQHGKLLGMLIPLTFILNTKEQFIQYNFLIFFISLIFMSYAATGNMKQNSKSFERNKYVN